MLVINLNLDKSEIPYISYTLLNNIEKTLLNKKKIILYLNKRGEYSALICKNCNYLYKCKNCDISLTIHFDKLICHLCGFKKKLDSNCEKCQSKELLKIGVGTKQIESNLKKYFSNKDVNILRFDFDSTKTKKSKKEILEKLYKADIIIATKMITTGFDFENIGLIGIILAEQEFSFPSYDAGEYGYINLKQLIGRGNRKGETTEIILQTFIPENSFIKTITEKNYKQFFIESLKERKTFGYPPFLELAILEYRHTNKQKSYDFILKLKNKLDLLNNNSNIEIIFNSQVFKKFNKYHYIILIKGTNLRLFLENIKKEIFRNKNLSLIFK